MLRLLRAPVLGVLALAVLAASPHAQEAPAPASPAPPSPPSPITDDLRTHYDVTYYRLDLQVMPESKSLAGIGVVQGRVLVDALPRVVIDLKRLYQVEGVHEVPLDCGDAKHVPLGKRLTFTRHEDQVIVTLPSPAAKGTSFAVAVRYRGTPKQSAKGFTGVHFRETPSGKPWINTSVQGVGSAAWWPSKDSFYYPGDKHDVMDLNITVPAGLVAACNGELTKAERVKGGRVRYRWHHPYGCCTYSIALNVAPYVELKDSVVLPGIERAVPIRYYILPKDVAKAKIQFAQVPELLKVYGEKFGPFPFPDAKFSLVQTNYWGMEHSTIVAYGSSFPAALKPGEPDRWASRNKWFDYILVHEVAHEWWGNAVSATDWGHFWVHEGFGTFAEVVWVEHVHGHDKMHKYVGELGLRVRDGSPVHRPNHKTGAAAYSSNIYYKGAGVLHQLRWVMGEEPFWKAVKRFHLAFRYKNASTEDFQRVCEEEADAKLGWFFKQWVYGTGRPAMRASIEREGEETVLITHSSNEHTATQFRWPVRLTIDRGGAGDTPDVVTHWIEPGNHRIVIAGATPDQITLEGLQWLVLRKR